MFATLFPETGEMLMSTGMIYYLLIPFILCLLWGFLSPKTFFGFGFIGTGIVGLFGAFYTGLWLMFVGGIIQIVDACKVTPTDSAGIAWGIVRIIFAVPAFWLVWFLSLFMLRIGMAIYDDRRHRTLGANWIFR
jgi:hypothetical protein